MRPYLCYDGLTMQRWKRSDQIKIIVNINDTERRQTDLIETWPATIT